jgi:GAF domain-containing protein
MTTDPVAGRLLTPADTDAPRRVQRLRELGLGEHPDPEFDAFAAQLAEATGSPFAMVNFIGDEQQYFSGLYVIPPHANMAQATEAAVQVGRTMPKDYGWCPHVVARGRALVLDDVCDYPRFATNPVVDRVGIRSYLGAPLIDQTGTTLGTVCVVDRQVHAWGREGLEFIKARAAEMVERINQRERSR